jgi:hypothetical protein
MIPGIRWIRAAVQSSLYDEVGSEKGRERGLTWDDLMSQALRSWVEQRRVARSMVVQPPTAAVTPATVVEPRSTTAPVPSSDEILRDEGHPSYQHGIRLRASATLSGEASIAAEGK